MSLTYRNGISRIRSLNKLISEDNSITDRVIFYELLATSSLLLKRELDAKKLWSINNLFTSIKCLKMEPVPIYECCNIQSYCTIMRSVCELPKIEEAANKLIMLPVTTIDNKIEFKEGSPLRYENLLKLGLPKSPKMFWVHNNRLYITSDSIIAVNVTFYSLLPNINLYGCSCNNDREIDNFCPVNPLDNEWKIPSYLEDNVIAIVHDKLSKTYFRHITDLLPNITNDEQR